MISYDYLYNKDVYRLDLYAEHLEEKELSWNVLEDVTLLPYKKISDNIGGGLVDNKGEYIDGSGLHEGIGCSYPYGKPTLIRDDPVVFLGLWPNIWGHCLTDNIRRLWVLNNSEFMRKYGNCSFVYIPFENRKLIPNFDELLQIIGVGEIILEPIDEITLLKKVILPDECFRRRNDGPRSYVTEFGTRLYTKEYMHMIDKVRTYGEAHLVRREYTKVYFTGRGRTIYNELGERHLELFFRRLGYKIIALENYSFLEQLNILLSCTDVVSTVGSVSHNFIFLRDKTRVCLIPRTSFISEYQFALDTIHDLDINYIDSTLSLYTHKKHPWQGPNYYIISDQLQRYFGTDVQYKVNRLKFFVYKRLCYCINGVFEPSLYYREIAGRYLKGDFTVHMNRNWFKICRKLKIWKIAAMLIKWLEEFENNI